MSHNTSNSTIAKNTLYMYLRMILVTIVGLYTSRIVLNVLGVENFGIYTLVGGIIVLFSFINNSLLSSTQRFLSFELGKENPQIKSVFTSCLKLHAFLSLIIFILAETVGLWFVNTQLVIPKESLYAANWVYQLSVFSCLLTVLRCPINAALVAYERISIYAYVGIIEAVFKLIVAIAIIYIPFDKLILYAVLTFITTVIILLINTIMALKKMPEIGLDWNGNGNTTKEILSFSKWTIFGSTANVSIEQGLSVIVNMFYGVTINAAIGIANQVNSHISSFVNNFQVAINPQLTKNEASKNRERQFNLIYKSSKFTYFIMLFIAAPIVLNLDYLLHLWLGKVPQQTVEICIFVIAGVLIETLSGPLWVTIFATGKVRSYQIIISLILMANIPAAIIIGELDCPAYMIYMSRASIYIMALTCRLMFLRKQIGLRIRDFAKAVILPTTIVTAIIISIIVAKHQFYAGSTIMSFMIESAVIILIEIVAIVYIGLSNNEKQAITNIIKRKLKP